MPNQVYMNLKTIILFHFCITLPHFQVFNIKINVRKKIKKKKKICGLRLAVKRSPSGLIFCEIRMIDCLRDYIEQAQKATSFQFFF